MKVLITEQQLRSIIVEQKVDPKPKIVGRDNMYNRLVKAFGSKVVGKFNDPDYYELNFPNKDWLMVNFYEGKWDASYYPEEKPSPLAYGSYYGSDGLLELIGDLDFKITFEGDDGTYDSQTKKWNGSSDVKPLPKRKDPTSIIQSNDIYRRLYKFYSNKLYVIEEEGQYGITIILDEKSNIILYNNYKVFRDGDKDEEVDISINPIGNDDFQINLGDGRIFNSQTKKWTKGKPFKTVSIEGKDMTEFASKIVKETKNLKIDLNSLKVDMDNFKLDFNTTEDGTPVYELYLSLNSSKNKYIKPSTILSNYPNSKIIGKGNFPNKPENNYTLIAIII